MLNGKQYKIVTQSNKMNLISVPDFENLYCSLFNANRDQILAYPFSF